MLQVTKDALKICTETVQQLGSPDFVKCLRVLELKDGVALSFECPRSDDEVMRESGSAVLAVPGKSIKALSHLTLDVDKNGTFVLLRS